MEPLINELKDIHSLPYPSLWPLALGWYLALGILFLGFLWIRKKRQKSAPRRKALVELKNIEKRGVSGQNSVVLAELSILLRRVSIAYFPTENVVGMTGMDWLFFLDRTGDTQAFSQGVGQVLLSGPYQKAGDLKIEGLFELIRDWIKKRG